MRIIGIATAALLVAGCNNSGQKAEAEAPVAALQPGEYSLSWSDVQTKSTAKKTDAAATAGRSAQMASAAFPERACVAAGGAIEPAAFGEKSDKCHVVNSYVRNGIVNVQVGCDREGKGSLTQIATGRFAADSFTATVETSSSFAGDGNFTMTRKVSARRVGQCAPAGSETAES